MLTNLTPATTYEYQVKAWYCNTTGSSTWSIYYIRCLSKCWQLRCQHTLLERSLLDDSNGPYSFVRIKLRVDSISNPTGSDWQNAGGFGVNYGTWTRNKNGLVAGETYRDSLERGVIQVEVHISQLTDTAYFYHSQLCEDGRYGISNLEYPNPSRY